MSLTPKPNTFYRLRCGRRAYIASMNPFEHTEGTDFIGVVDGGEEECWAADGRYFTGGENSPYDLVEELPS